MNKILELEPTGIRPIYCVWEVCGNRKVITVKEKSYVEVYMIH